MNRHLVCIFLLALTSSSTMAFQLEESSSKFSTQNGVAVIQEPGVTYTVAEIPTAANRFESTTSLAGHPDFSNLTLGNPMDNNEAVHVVEEYYRHVAFDFNSVVIRDFRLGSQNYVFWCANSSLFGCLNWEGRSGTWVEFALNGSNRSGGLTGFRRTILLIRKVTGITNLLGK